MSPILGMLDAWCGLHRNDAEVGCTSGKPRARFAAMDTPNTPSQFEALSREDILEHLSSPRRERAEAIQRLYSSPEQRSVAEELIRLEIDDHARSVFLDSIKEQQKVVGL